jgi:hypothetical protein
MSYKILGPAWEANLSCPAKLILISLADQANDHGICWPSVQTMISRTGLCDRAVRGHLADLESAGHITRDFRSGRSTVYRIHPIATPAKECTPEKEFRTAPDAGLPLHQMQDTPAPRAPITVIEPKVNRNTKDTPPAFAAKAALSALGVNDQIASDWIQHRKALKTTVTQTVIDGIAREAAKARIALSDALAMSCERGWRGFKAEWVAEAIGQKTNGYKSRADSLADTARALTTSQPVERIINPF